MIAPSAILLPVKRRAARMICHPIVGRVLRRRGPVQRLSDVLLDLDEEFFDPRVVARLWWRVYESGELRLIDRHLRGDLDVIELGSSMGVTSVHIARRLRDGRRLVCVEANPRLIEPLRRTLTRNTVAAIVDHAAVAYGVESVGFAFASQTNAGRVDPAAEPAVRATTLKDLCRIHSIDRFCLVADIEGAEVHMLEHDAAALESCQQILIELHATEDGRGYPVTISDLKERITALGFVIEAGSGPVLAFRRS